MGKEALDRLRKTEPAEYLSPSSELSRLARAASSHLYSSLVPFSPTKPTLHQLLSEESFDAEQIWSQIDLLSKPLLPFLRRHLSRLEKQSKLHSLLPRPTLKSTATATATGNPILCHCTQTISPLPSKRITMVDFMVVKMTK